MKKLIISGSAKFQEKYLDLVKTFSPKYDILDFPKIIHVVEFEKKYPEVLSNYYKNIEKSDIFLLANFDKNGVSGFIGAAAFAELSYAVIRKINYDQNIEIYLLQQPPEDFFAKDEISLWIKYDWVKIADDHFFAKNH